MDTQTLANRKTERLDKTDIPNLVEQLQSEDGVARERARRRLVAMGSRATNSLLPLLGHKRQQDRWEAVKALSDIGDPAVTERMVTLLRDDDSDIAWLAALALIKIGRPVLVPLMERVIDQPESVRLRRGVHHILKELQNEVSDVDLKPILDLLNEHVDHERIPVLADQIRKQLLTGQ